MRRSILFICGSINQTSQLHAVARHLPEFDHAFTPYYGDGAVEWIRSTGLLANTVIGDKLRQRCLAYLDTHDLAVDLCGAERVYDLVVTCSDLVVPRNTRGRKMVLVQEGMTDPENLLYHIVRRLRLPRYFASTATTGLSHAYDYFCVASEGYRAHFIRKGVDPWRIRVTGIPNFDDCNSFRDNDFPHTGYVMVATSDARETFKYEDRRAFIERARRIADGRLMLFKLHPNENIARATQEIERWAPGSLVFTGGNTNHMIANCDTLVTKYSSVVYVGLALGKTVHSAFDIEDLRRMMPMQNGARSALAIADVCRRLIEDRSVPHTFDALVASAQRSGTGSLITQEALS